MTALEKNEANRWSYMTLEQMERRLDKITNPEKLKAFAHFAWMFGRRKLAAKAKQKLLTC